MPAEQAVLGGVVVGEKQDSLGEILHSLVATTGLSKESHAILPTPFPRAVTFVAAVPGVL